jgi:Fe2+ or Zn2+ uptake regulation protein
MACGEQLEIELRREGYRVTPQRAVILETIAHLDGHSSAHEVFDLAKGRLPGLNLVTVYRTLDTLQKAGLIDLLAASGDSMRFSLRDQSNRHGHLQCKVCGLVFEIPAQHFSSMLADIENSYGFKVESDHLTLPGICDACGLEHSNRHIEAKKGRD